MPQTKTWAILDKLLNYVTEPDEPNKLISPLGDFTKDHSTNHRWKVYKNGKEVYTFDNERSLWK